MRSPGAMTPGGTPPTQAHVMSVNSERELSGPVRR
jgi:hypothetical protein